METLWQDVRYAARGLAKARGFTLAAVLTLALGIGANTAIFTVVEASLLRSLPFRDPERLVHLWETRTNRQFAQREASYPNYLDWLQQNTVFDGIAGYNGTNLTLSGEETPERISATRVTANFFTVLGVEPQLGRAFLKEEEAGSAAPATVVTHGFWQRRLGGAPEALGRAVSLGGVAHTVIGVLPQNFSFGPEAGAQLFVGLAMNDDQRARRSNHWLRAVARLKPGITIAQADKELSGIAARLAAAYPETNRETGARVVPLRDEIVGPIRPMLSTLFYAVVLLLLLACVNVANLVLARSAARSRDTAVRMALGAGRARLIRQLLAESVLLALAGGTAALVLAANGVSLLVALLPAGMVARLPQLREPSLEPSVFLFATAVSLLTGLGCGLWPAWHATRVAPNDALKDGRTAGASRAHQRVRGALVVAQISLALVLLAGTGLVLRSLQNLLEVDPGFRTAGLMTFRMSLPAAKYGDNTSVASFYSRVKERVAGVPGVQGVALVDEMPVTHDNGTWLLSVEGRPEPPPGQEQEAVRRTVDESYFAMMGIRLIAGRTFSAHDSAERPRVAVINEALAKRLFPNETPIGRAVHVNLSTRLTMQIVGVVADVRMAGLDRDVRPAIYTHDAQNPSRTVWLLARSGGDLGTMANIVRREVRALDAELPVYGTRTIEQLIQTSEGVFVRRSMSLLLGGFAVVALLLAALGLYAVMSFSVTQRTREIGVRMALGAEQRDVLRMVLKQGLRLAAMGTGIGVAGALATGELIRGFLFGIAPRDPLTLAAVALVPLTVALLACALPARRASRVDPLVALRCE